MNNTAVLQYCIPQQSYISQNEQCSNFLYHRPSSLPTCCSYSGGGYSFQGNGWVQEWMGSPRVMPDATLLPNGVVILLNGAFQGYAGSAFTLAYYPNFYAEMYNPYGAIGSRWTTLWRSPIARLYHSTAVLTTDGTILVGGCDVCSGITTNLTYSPGGYGRAEYRMEIFYPPFWFDFANKPQIKSAPSSVNYNAAFTVIYTGKVRSMCE